MTGWGWAAPLLLFFAPLAFIYGRSLAGRAQAQAAARNRSARAVMLPKLVLPALVAAALGVRFSGTTPENWPITVPSATLRGALALLWTLGSAAGILFFLAIPFVVGRAFALVAVCAGWFAHVRDEPLRFGTSGYKTGDDETGDDETVGGGGGREPGGAGLREMGFREASRRSANEDGSDG